MKLSLEYFSLTGFYLGEFCFYLLPAISFYFRESIFDGEIAKGKKKFSVEIGFLSFRLFFSVYW